jgi:AraC-like DNA-binding protein
MTDMANEHHPLNQIEIEPIDKEAFTVHLQAGRFDVAWHTHSQHQLIYAENGVVHICTEARAFLLPANHGAWIPANCAHRLHSDTAGLQLWLLYFRPREPEHEALGQLRLFFISTLAREMILFTARWSIEGEANETEHYFYETARLLAIEWCSQPLPLTLPLATESLLEEVTTYIQGNLTGSLQLESIALKYGVSSRTLMRMFRKHLGMTFGEYVRIARMVKAVELLTQPSMTVTEVAYAVGYNSLSSFSQMFRRLIGLTPYEYIRGEKRR